MARSDGPSCRPVDSERPTVSTGNVGPYVARALRLRVGPSRLQRLSDVRDEETEEGAHRQHPSTGTRHEREDHHARLPLRLHR